MVGKSGGATKSTRKGKGWKPGLGYNVLVEDAQVIGRIKEFSSRVLAKGSKVKGGDSEK